MPLLRHTNLAGSASAAAGIGLTAAFEGVTFARRTAGSVKKLREEKLSGGQFAGEMAKHVAKGVFSGGGAVGQMAVPVPVLGAVIGGVIGNMIGKGAGYVAADVAPGFLMKDGQKWKVREGGEEIETEPEGQGKMTTIDTGL
ncbi:Hypp5725 [Branchiostoma lanceolatum]|uniref:Hypp5725 protein n=1 Tax=Branchiostoma lanceolatum TaxID=7740 RepID=A0A8J9W4C5_BRALA|nr:Hypp5725 [Branchiostoma lanceolatum]